MKALPFINNRPGTLTLLILLLGSVAPAAFGQAANYTWIGAANGTNLDTPGNFTTNGVNPAITLPNGADLPQESVFWNGRTTTNLNLSKGGINWPGTGLGSFGVNLVVTANQTNDVQMVCSVSASTINVFGITNNSASATFILGDNTSNQLGIITRPGVAGTVHYFVNNSANAVVINPSVQWLAGGGVACVFDFGGTGNWTVRNNLRDNNTPGGITIVWEGPGTMTWSAGGIFVGSSPLGPIDIHGGTVILKSPGLALNFTGAPVGKNTITNNGTLQFDAAAQSDTIARDISGTGLLKVSNGTLTLSGANTYTGSTVLTGGTLIVSNTENAGVSGPLGVGGTISFTGGTLGFSASNVFDYSSRFSTAAGQQYRIDTGGENVLFTNAAGLGSVGGTLIKVGSGTLTLAGANTYGGATTISAGKLVFQGAKSGFGNITVADGAALGVFANGTQVTPGRLTVGTSSGGILEFNSISNTTTAPLAPTTLSSTGMVTINVNSGTFTAGQSYPLFSWISGTAPAVSLGFLSGALGNLSTNGNTIQLNITETALIWTGVNNGSWDTTTTNNWTFDGSPTTYSDPARVQFDDTASGTTIVTLNNLVQPTSITVNNSSKTYSITSSGGNNIGGSTGLTKRGTGTLTLSGGANTYSGPTFVNGGKLVFQGSKSGSGNITVADGAVLGITDTGAQMTPGALTLGASSGMTLEFNNVTNTTTAPLAPATLSSAGTVAININSGAVTVGQSYPLFSWISGLPPAVSLIVLNGFVGNLSTNGNTIRLNITATAYNFWTGLNNGSWDLSTPNNWRQNGNPMIFSDGIPAVLDDTATGTTAVTVNAMVQPSALTISNSSKTYSIASSSGKNIGGSTGLTKSGTGTLTLSGGVNTYTGVTMIDNGVLSVNQLANSGSASDIGAGSSAADLVLNGGTLRYAGFQTSINRLFTLGTGGGAIESSAGILNLNNSGPIVVSGSGSRVLTLIASSGVVNTLAASVSDSPAGGVTSLTKSGNGNWFLSGTNTYSGPTTIAAGTLEFGGTGSLGSGNIIDNGQIVFHFSDDLTISAIISGTGHVVKFDSGTIVLPGSNTYTGDTIVFGGTLIINSNSAAATTSVVGGTLGGRGKLAGPVTLDAGTTLAPGASAGSIGTLTINNNLSVGGNLAIEVNKSLSPSNDLVVVSGVLANTGTGTLTVANLGPVLVAGDKFTLFSKPVQNGAALSVTGGNATWTNNLAVDGSISVVIGPPVLNFVNTGSGLQFSWTGSFKLQSQTNGINVGLTGNWADYPGGGSSGITVPIDATQETVFFRLVSP